VVDVVITDETACSQITMPDVAPAVCNLEWLEVRGVNQQIPASLEHCTSLTTLNLLGIDLTENIPHANATRMVLPQVSASAWPNLLTLHVSGFDFRDCQPDDLSHFLAPLSSVTSLAIKQNLMDQVGFRF
jgi:hypothetical protein